MDGLVWLLYLHVSTNTKLIVYSMELLERYFSKTLTRGTPGLAREDEAWGVQCELKAWSMFHLNHSNMPYISKA